MIMQQASTHNNQTQEIFSILLNQYLYDLLENLVYHQLCHQQYLHKYPNPSQWLLWIAWNWGGVQIIVNFKV